MKESDVESQIGGENDEADWETLHASRVDVLEVGGPTNSVSMKSRS